MDKEQDSKQSNYSGLRESEVVDIFNQVDHSLIQQPLQTGIQNVLQILKCMKHGTTEVRHLILRGCNIIYECKICSSLYRSLANFLLHKRLYCKNETRQVFSATEDSTQTTTPCDSPPEHPDPPDFEHNDAILNDFSVKQEDDGHSEYKESGSNGLENVSFQGYDSKNREKPSIKCEEQSPTIENTDINSKPLPSNAPAMSFSNMNSRAKRLSRRTDCCLTSLMCLKCNTKYTSIKTLYFHMITIHSNKRQYYPCPFCENSFVQMWGVTRHLTQVHSKSKEEVNKLKEIVRRNAFMKREHSKLTSKTITNGMNKTYGSYKGNGYCKGFNVRSSQLKCYTQSKGSSAKIKANVPFKRVSSSAIEKKVKGMIDAKKLICLKCRRKFSTFSNLRRHAAIHAGWTRYMCQRCSYQSYNRSDCRTHIQRIHAPLGVDDIEKSIISLPSVKVSITKGNSMKEYPIKSRKNYKTVGGRNLAPNNKTAKINRELSKKHVKWNGLNNSDNHVESLVTRSRKYVKVQTNFVNIYDEKNGKESNSCAESTK